MESKVNLAAVGAFVIVLTLAMMSGVLWLTSGKYQRKAYDTYETYMAESVSGLSLNAPVRYLGVDVGRVRTIMLAPGNVEQVRMTLDIERGTPIKVDTLASLQTQGLTGIAFVELAAGRKDSPALVARPGEPYPVIASAPSLIGRLETAMPELLANLVRVTDNLNALLDDDNRQAVRATLADLALLTRALAGRSASIDGTLDHAARAAAELPVLARRFERAAEAVERMAVSIAGAASGASGTLASASGTLASARRTLDSATGAIDDSRAEVAQFTATTLPEARELVAELRELTSTMRRVVDEVERDPATLLRGRRPARRGPGEGGDG